MHDEEGYNARWWLVEDDSELAQDLIQVFDHLNENDRGRQAQNLHHLRLYGNMPVEGVNPSDFNRLVSQDSVTFNVVANVCDVATARIGKQRPSAKFLPMGGNWTLTRKSRLLERFVQAQFRISKTYAASRAAFLDATVLGTGVLKIYDQGKKICVERVFPSELVVDPLEALYGEPRQIMQRKWISREVLKETFLKGKKGVERKRIERAIRDANVDRDNETDAPSSALHEHVGDQVLVVEAWHLPSGPDAKDGRHAIITDAGPLFIDDWSYDYIPFLFIDWKKRLRGFWGVGLAEELCGIQIEINRLLMRLQKGHQRLGHPMIFLDARSKVQKNAMTNEIGSFVHYMGTPPIVQTFATAQPEIYAHLDRLYNRAFDLAGLSQETAAPQQQSISGISAQTQHEIGTERFSIQAQDFEEMHLDIARQMIDRAKDIAKRHGGEFATAAEKDKNTISSIDWSEVDMEEDEYIIQVLPVSSLPQLPGPRQDRVLQLMQSGIIDPDTARELLDFPDLERHNDLASAARRSIERSIENMLDESIYEAPEPHTDLLLSLKMVQAAYNKALNDGVPEDNLVLLRQYMTEAHRLMQKAQAEQMKIAAANAAQQAPAAPAPGAPLAPGPDGQPPGAVTAQ